MLRKLTVWFALLTAATSLAAAQNFLLGVDYSELISVDSLTTIYGALSSTVVATGTDSHGSIYLLVDGLTSTQATSAAYYVVKLAPAGDQVVYQTLLNSQPSAMAVDPAGNVYLAANNTVQKLGTDGKTVVYTATIAPDALVTALTADAQGRVYATGWTATGDLTTTPGALQQIAPPVASINDAFVVRLKSGGTVDYATYLEETARPLDWRSPWMARAPRLWRGLPSRRRFRPRPALTWRLPASPISQPVRFSRACLRTGRRSFIPRSQIRIMTPRAILRWTRQGARWWLLMQAQPRRFDGSIRKGRLWSFQRSCRPGDCREW